MRKDKENKSWDHSRGEERGKKPVVVSSQLPALPSLQVCATAAGVSLIQGKSTLVVC